MRVLVTEMAGRASVELKGRELGYDLSSDREAVGRVVERVKDLESQGWTFEAADASFELLLREETGAEVHAPFVVESWRTIVEQRADGAVVSEATVKLRAGDGADRVISTREGNGPVNALDNALRAALIATFPELEDLELVDYKVRILEGNQGTGAVTRVLIDTSNGEREWTTVGVHENVIAASWLALEDAVEYGLLRRAQASPVA
jgi:2-isopropylmalate synthase